MTIPSLISCQWLYDKIKTGDLEGIVIVDVSWASTRDCHEEYKKQHIPGAAFINVLDAEHTDVYPRNIPTPENFTTAARQAGVNSSSHVIVYSNSDRAGFFLAGRGWWTFRLYGHSNVSVLDGGLGKWMKLGYPTTSECSEIKTGNFTACRDNSVYKSLTEIQENIKAQSFQLIDSRPHAAHNDSHIPGARNIPLSDLVDDSSWLLKPKDELRKIFMDRTVDLSKPVVTHCNSGMSSCAVSFICELLGCPSVAVFHGGYTEWKAHCGAQT